MPFIIGTLLVIGLGFGTQKAFDYNKRDVSVQVTAVAAPSTALECGGDDEETLMISTLEEVEACAITGVGCFE